MARTAIAIGIALVLIVGALAFFLFAGDDYLDTPIPESAAPGEPPLPGAPVAPTIAVLHTKVLIENADGSSDVITRDFQPTVIIGTKAISALVFSIEFSAGESAIKMSGAQLRAVVSKAGVFENEYRAYNSPIGGIEIAAGQRQALVSARLLGSTLESFGVGVHNVSFKAELSIVTNGTTRLVTAQYTPLQFTVTTAPMGGGGGGGGGGSCGPIGPGCKVVLQIASGDRFRVESLSG